jgi:DNA-binding LacI/PurR family transcriptional regulator
MDDKPLTPTIRDVARKAGVSVATVSRVINKTAVIAADTEARVQAAILELDYFPKSAARSLSNRKTNVIGLLLPGIVWDNFFPPMLRGIEAACYAAGFNLLISSTQHPSIGPGQRRPIGDHNTDGMILFPGCVDDEEVLRMQAKGFPVILLYRAAPKGSNLPHIEFENKNGTRQMMDHLIETHGFTRIGFLAGPSDNEDAGWRELGYREALAAHNLPYDPDLVKPGMFDEGVAHAVMANWLKRGLDVQAICAADDDSAQGALRALHEAGRRVPEDVALVGFDDSPTSSLLDPPLTTIRAPIEESGRQAATLLAELIRTGETAIETLLPTELIVRRSCGCKIWH